MPSKGDTLNLLFVTWDGPQSLYVESLFLPIFAALRGRGIVFHILQFGWSEAAEVDRIAQGCAAAGVPYRYRAIWRRPVALGSIATALAGRIWVGRAIRDWSIDIVLPRSYLPSFAAIGPAYAAGCPVLLDADGLPNDERLEFAGQSRRSLSHRLLERAERWAVRSADAILVRTRDGADILAERAGTIDPARFRIVANARDEAAFRPGSDSERLATRKQLGLSPHAPVAIFVGSSVSGKYDGQGVIDFLDMLRSHLADARLLLVTPQIDEAKRLVEASRASGACIVMAAPPDAVPGLIRAADVGLSLIHPTFSMQAASAIKTGEYLLCGVPVVATAGVGGIERILTRDTGFVIDDAAPASLETAAGWVSETVLPGRSAVRSACRALGLKHFSLGTAIDSYEAAIRAAGRARS